MNTFFRIIFPILIISALTGCTTEDQPGTTGSEVVLSIPDTFTIEADTRSIEFGVVDGKAPKQTDMIILDGPEGQKFCKLLSVSSSKVIVELYNDVKEGQHKVSLQRGLDIISLGTTKFVIPTSDDGLAPDSGSSIYGKVSCNGAGVPDVAVSDGYEIVITDKDGVYQMNSKKKHGYVFVSVPSGYTVPTDIVFPQFYKYLTTSASVAERVDFELTPVQNPDDFTLLVFGDMHLANRSAYLDREQFAFFLDDVNKLWKSTSGHIYGLTLGDMTWDRYWLDNNYYFPEYIEEMKPLTGLPVFQTPGNHDHDMAESGDFNTMIKYKSFLGPSYYSHNIGKVHFVTLDDIDCKNPGGGGSSEYSNNLVQEQLDWLAKDLANVSKDTPLIVSMHANFFSNPGTGTTPKYAMSAASAAQLEDILDDFNAVHIFTAHTHRVYNVDNSQTKNGIYEHNAGAVCAAWWVSGSYHQKSNLAADGVPGGYTIVKVKGTDISWQFKGTQRPVTQQFQTYDRNCIDFSASKLFPDLKAAYLTEWNDRTKTWSGPSTANEVYINVWNYDLSWKIEVTENGTPLTVTRVGDHDPLYLLAYTYERFWRNLEAGHNTSNNWHTFRVKASSPTSTLEIKVTDRFGNVYTETMKRPKEFKVRNYYWDAQL